jgi:hypothetical protein
LPSFSIFYFFIFCHSLHKKSILVPMWREGSDNFFAFLNSILNALGRKKTCWEKYNALTGIFFLIHLTLSISPRIMLFWKKYNGGEVKKNVIYYLKCSPILKNTFYNFEYFYFALWKVCIINFIVQKRHVCFHDVRLMLSKTLWKIINSVFYEDFWNCNFKRKKSLIHRPNTKTKSLLAWITKELNLITKIEWLIIFFIFSSF